jgi:DNA-binding NtrC family response regulator
MAKGNMQKVKSTHALKRVGSGNVKPQSADPQAARIILLCEEESQGLEMAQVLLDAGYAAEIYTQLSAIKSICAGKETPAAVILDMTMPESGDELSRIIQTLNEQCQPGMALIYLTAHNNVEARLAAYRAGITRRSAWLLCCKCSLKWL